MSQNRETLEQANATLFGYLPDGEVLVKEDDGPDGIKVYFPHDDNPGYTLEINGIGHEFARTATPADLEAAGQSDLKMLPDGVLDIVYNALRNARGDSRINDVTMDRGIDRQRQIILTTDNGHHKQVWVIDAESILESDPVEE